MNRRLYRLAMLGSVLSFLTAVGCATFPVAPPPGGRSATVRDITTVRAVPQGVDRHCLDAAGSPPDAPVVVLSFLQARMPRRIALPLRDSDALETGGHYRLDTGACRLLPAP